VRATRAVSKTFAVSIAAVKARGYSAASSSALGRGVHFLARDAASSIKGQVWAITAACTCSRAAQFRTAARVGGRVIAASRAVLLPLRERMTSEDG
jgi:hypothetical protein